MTPILLTLGAHNKIGPSSAGTAWCTAYVFSESFCSDWVGKFGFTKMAPLHAAVSNSLFSQLDMIRGILETPSLYGWLIPRIKTPAEVDALASQGGFPTLMQLAPAALYCIAFGLARLVLTRLVFKPLAIYSMNLRISANSQPIHAVDVYVSENQYEKTAKKTKKRVAKDVDTLVQELLKLGVANKAELGEKASPAALRLYLIGRRRSQVVERKVVKFVEALWRGIFYFVFVVIGATFLFYPEPQEWVLDTRKHWLAWPQPVSTTVLVYYQLALGCYLHQLMWTEVSRSDALEMIVHHITTILLLGMSFLTQFTRGRVHPARARRGRRLSGERQVLQLRGTEQRRLQALGLAAV